MSDYPTNRELAPTASAVIICSLSRILPSLFQEPFHSLAAWGTAEWSCLTRCYCHPEGKIFLPGKPLSLSRSTNSCWPLSNRHRSRNRAPRHTVRCHHQSSDEPKGPCCNMRQPA